MKRVVPLSVAAGLVVVALAAGRAHGAPAFPEGLYEALAEAPDLAGAVATCASEKHESKVAAARRAFAISSVTLTSGITIYRVDGADPCIGANQNSPLLAFVASGPNRFRQVLSTGVDSAKFGADGSLVAESRDSAATHDVVTYRFDGATYAEVRDELFDEANGRHKRVRVPIRFAAGTSSATMTGTVSDASVFPDSYLVNATAGRTMTIVVRPTSGKIGPLTILQDAATSGGAIWNPPALSWHAKLPKTGTYAISVQSAGDAAASYSMTVRIVAR